MGEINPDAQHGVDGYDRRTTDYCSKNRKQTWAAQSMELQTAICPQLYANAQEFVRQNIKKIDLSFGLKDATIGKILKSWAGHKISVHLRIRKRNGKSGTAVSRSASASAGGGAPGDYPDVNCSVEEFVESMGDRLPEFTVLYGSRLLEENIRTFLLSVRNRTNIDRPAPRMDESIRKIQSLPWNLLRHSSISS